ncbi:MAG: hypothetical protein FJ350_05315 [Sphingomonadales bacterium]|nr:hypothetical protein [Sphingomonadales bacterium]
MKVTRLFFVFIISLFPLLSFAQKPVTGRTTLSLKSVGDFKSSLEAGLNLDGPTISIPSIRYRYFLSNDFALRSLINVSGNKTKLVFYENPNFSGMEGTNDSSNVFWNVQLGLEYHLPGTSKLSPYFGLFFHYGQGRTSEKWTNFNGLLNGGQGDFERSFTGSVEMPETTIGIGSVAGLDFYFVDRVYAGLELYWLYKSTMLGSGKVEYQSNSSSNSEFARPERTFSSSTFSSIPSIRVGWRF